MECKHKIEANPNSSMPWCKICGQSFTVPGAREEIRKQAKNRKRAEYESKLLLIDMKGISNKQKYEQRKNEILGESRQLFHTYWVVGRKDMF